MSDVNKIPKQSNGDYAPHLKVTELGTVLFGSPESPVLLKKYLTGRML